MRYTYKKMAGVLCMMLGIMMISRIVPDWLFYSLIAIIGISILYLMYYYSRF